MNDEEVLETEDFTNFGLLVPRKPWDDESFFTSTSFSQLNTEELIEESFRKYFEHLKLELWEPKLLRYLHINFLNTSLLKLPQNCQILDCNRTWMCYWITHSLYLLNVEPSDSLKADIANFLARCQNETGGFGGGPGQMAHLAPTYAAVCSIATLGTTYAFNVINRKTLLKFLNDLSVGDGSFHMHKGGEIDVRAVYCALAVARLTNIYNDQLFKGSDDWIVSCQTYEGGFAAFPGSEAHGGYSFCAIAALHILQKQYKCDLQALLRWSVNCQMKFEGGFQGRTNKLVDGCYSFWQGSTVVLSTLLPSLPSSNDTRNDEGYLFNSEALQEYILICCQDSKGGLKDKPKTTRDCYHSCYTLGGLSLAQHLPFGGTNVIGHPSNLLPPIDPVYNVGIDKIRLTLEFFNSIHEL